jgi:HD superfamily phosphohydrolase YqeK
MVNLTEKMNRHVRRPAPPAMNLAGELRGRWFSLCAQCALIAHDCLRKIIAASLISGISTGL